MYYRRRQQYHWFISFKSTQKVNDNSSIEILFCSMKRTLAISSFWMRIFRLLIKKSRICTHLLYYYSTIQCNTDSAKVNRSKHFFLSFFFFSFHFIRNSITRYLLYHWLQFFIITLSLVDFNLFVIVLYDSHVRYSIYCSFVFRSFLYQFFKLTFSSIKSNIVSKAFRLYDFKSFVSVSWSLEASKIKAILLNIVFNSIKSIDLRSQFFRFRFNFKKSVDWSKNWKQSRVFAKVVRNFCNSTKVYRDSKYFQKLIKIVRQHFSFNSFATFSFNNTSLK